MVKLASLIEQQDGSFAKRFMLELQAGFLEADDLDRDVNLHRVTNAWGDDLFELATTTVDGFAKLKAQVRVDAESIHRVAVHFDLSELGVKSTATSSQSLAGDANFIAETLATMRLKLLRKHFAFASEAIDVTDALLPLAKAVAQANADEDVHEAKRSRALAQALSAARALRLIPENVTQMILIADSPKLQNPLFIMSHS